MPVLSPDDSPAGFLLLRWRHSYPDACLYTGLRITISVILVCVSGGTVMKVFVLIILVAVLFPPLAASQDCIDYGEYLHWAGGVDTVATKYSIRGRIEPVKLAVTVGSWDFSGKGTLSRRHVRLRLRRFPASCFCKTDQSTL